jgi:hypothetical protein
MLGGRDRVKRPERQRRDFAPMKWRLRVTISRLTESLPVMPRSSRYQVSTAELRSRIGGQSPGRIGVDRPSVAIVALAMLTVPLAMWLMSLIVRWAG